MLRDSIEIQETKNEEDSSTHYTTSSTSSPVIMPRQESKGTYERIRNLIGEKEYEVGLLNAEYEINEYLANKLNLKNITLSKMEDQEFIKTIQDLLEATTSGNLFYLRLVKHVIDDITDPVVIDSFVTKFEKNITEEIVLGLIVVFKAAIKEKKIQLTSQSKKSDIAIKTSEQFFNRFLNMCMTMDPTSSALINKILAPRLIKIRQIIGRVYVENHGSLNRELVEELKRAARAFPETTGKENDPGCAKMTPAGVKRVCQILLPLCHLIVGPNIKSKIKHTVTFDNGEVLDIHLSSEAIALAFSIIKDVNLDLAIEDSQIDFKKKISKFNGESSQLVTNIVPYLFDNVSLHDDLIDLSFDFKTLTLPLQLLSDTIKDPVALELLKKNSSGIIDDFIQSIKQEIKQIIDKESYLLSEIKTQYTTFILKCVYNYHKKHNSAETNKNIYHNLLPEKIDQFFEKLYHMAKPSVVAIQSSPSEQEKIINDFFVSLEKTLDNFPIELKYEIQSNFRYALSSVLAELAFIYEVNKNLELITKENFSEKIRAITHSFKRLHSTIIAEKSRITLRMGSYFQQLAEEFGKIANTNADINLLLETLITRKYANLENLNPELAVALQEAINTSSLSEKDLKKIFNAFKKVKFKKLLKLKNKSLGEALYQATEKHYSLLKNNDIVKILKAILGRDLALLKQLKNETLGSLLYFFLNEDIELTKNLELSASQEIIASFGISGLTITPDKIITWLIKSMLKNKPLPKTQDIPAMAKGIAIQQAPNLESTLRQALADIFKVIPSLEHAFENTPVRLFSAFKNFIQNHTSQNTLYKIIKNKLIFEDEKIIDKTVKNKNKLIFDSLAKLEINSNLLQKFIITLLHSSDFLSTFRTLWEKNNFKELVIPLVSRCYNGSNSFMFLIHFLNTIDTSNSKSYLLQNIASHCDSIIRMGLMDTTTLAIEQIGKLEVQRQVVTINKDTTNVDELLNQEILYIGTQDKIIDYAGNKFYYSDLLVTSFLGMAFPEVINHHSEFARFIRTLRTQSYDEFKPLKNVIESSLKAYQLKEWNHLIYSKINRLLLTKKSSLSPLAKLFSGLPLAINARDISSSKRHINLFIAKYQSGPVLPIIKSIFRQLRSELGIDGKELNYAIEKRDVNKVQKLLEISGSFDISILMSCAKENIILKALFIDEFEIAVVILRHCVNHEQLYPILQTFIEIPDALRHRQFFLELLSAFQQLGLEKAYVHAIKSLLNEESNELNFLSLLSLGLDLGSASHTHSIFIKILENIQEFPFIDHLRSIILQQPRTKYFKSVNIDILNEPDLQTILNELQKSNTPFLTYFSALGNNPLVQVIHSKNKNGLHLLVDHCIQTRQPYPLLDALFSCSVLLKSYESRLLFESAFNQLSITVALQNNDNLFNSFINNEHMTTVQKFEMALTFGAIGYTKILHQAALSLLQSHSIEKFTDVLLPYFNSLQPNLVLRNKLVYAIKKDDLETIKILLAHIKSYDLSILTAHDMNPIKLAFNGGNGNNKIAKVIIDHCLSTHQLLPILNAIGFNGITKEEELLIDLEDALSILVSRVKRTDTLVTQNDIDKSLREREFLDWYGETAPISSKSLSIFEKTPQELKDLCYGRLHTIQLINPFLKFMRFTKQLKRLALNGNELASSTLQFIKHCLLTQPEFLINSQTKSALIFDDEMLASVLFIFELNLELIFNDIMQNIYPPETITTLLIIFQYKQDDIVSLLLNEFVISKQNCSSQKLSAIFNIIDELRRNEMPAAKYVYHKLHEEIDINSINTMQMLIKTTDISHKASPTMFFVNSERNVMREPTSTTLSKDYNLCS